MKARISESMRRQVAERAEYRCEYCLIPEKFLASILDFNQIERIMLRQALISIGQYPNF